MKIIHTADWHLGQTFFEYDRKGEHTLFLTWLREQVKVHEVDGLFIAGDLFDIPNLSAERSASDVQRTFCYTTYAGQK